MFTIDLSVRKFFSHSIVHCLWYRSFLTHDLFNLIDCLVIAYRIELMMVFAWILLLVIFGGIKQCAYTLYLYLIHLINQYQCQLVITVLSIRRRGFMTSR